MDIDGDGRVDFVQAKYGSTTNGAWRNSGHGWDKMPAWQLPQDVYLADDSGRTQGNVFADVNKDGLPDLILGMSHPMGHNLIWLNTSRSVIASATIWQQQTGNASADNVGPVDIDPALVADLDGDGRPEFLHMYPVSCNTQGGPNGYAIDVLSTDGNSWQTASCAWTMLQTACPPRTYSLRDVDQDGFADAVADDGKFIYLNTGHVAPCTAGAAWKEIEIKGADVKRLVATGDIDGDGLRDDIFLDTMPNDLTPDILRPYDDPALVYLNSGKGLAATQGAKGYADAANVYGFVRPNWAWRVFLGNSDIGRYQVADLNGDGRADLVVNHSWGGSPLINRSRTFEDVGRISNSPYYTKPAPFVDNPPAPGSYGSNWVVPTGVSPDSVSMLKDKKYTYPIDSFVDIDGDGIVDRIQFLVQCDPSEDKSCTTPYVKKVYLNKYRPPVITKFPNGLASPTVVDYAVINADGDNTYRDGVPLAGDASYFGAPLRVAKSVTVDNGVGSTATTEHSYDSLRMSASGRGPLGFKYTTVTDPLGYQTVTTYSQEYPTIGMPTAVVRSKVGIGVVGTTSTKYAYFTAATGGIFVHPDSVEDYSYLYASPTPPTTRYPLAEVVITRTEYVYDGRGNARTTAVTTTRGGSARCPSGAPGGAGTGGSPSTSGHCESYSREVHNAYGASGSAEEKRGKVTETIVRSIKIAPQDPQGNPPVIHTTGFEYSRDGKLALIKKKIEPNAEVGIRLDTAYAYDQFGNTINTTVCASDFDSCNPGAVNPSDTSKSDHPPFRRTDVSYNPADFGPSAGAPIAKLAYKEVGRFPVKTTNSFGQNEYSAYEPNLGVLLQTTGPNGIHTSFKYDDVGWKKAQIERDGSEAPLTTTTERYLAGPSDAPTAKLVTVTRPPASGPTWVYTDAKGRTVETLGMNFAGGFTETLSEYDEAGRMKRSSKPFFQGETIYWNTPSYDLLDRLFMVTQDLGVVDGTGPVGSTAAVTSTQTTSYAGMTTSTSTTVKGKVRTRKETKNGLGKVSSVTDANGVSISFKYDAEGNLVETLDPAGNKMRIAYDLRGRKWQSEDPDLGQWNYTYDGFGGLLTQTDGKKQTTTMTYDKLGRMTSKTDAAGTSTWIYDVAPGAGVGKLAAVIGPPDPILKAPCIPPAFVPNTVPTDGNRAMSWPAYNALGELVESSECTDHNTYSTQYDYYVSSGQQGAVRYPAVQGSRFSVKYNYTSLGFLHYVSDAADGKVYWEVKATNAAGQVIDERTRNGVETLSARNPATGWLLGQTVTAHADQENVIQDLRFKFDEVGNLMTRMRSSPRDMADSVETFGYDSLDRLTSAGSDSFAYDDIGNLTQKGGKTYLYTGCAAGGGPHAVCSVGGGQAFLYDPNGNMVAGNGHYVTYTPRNKVQHIERPSSTTGGSLAMVDFAYGADGNRVVQSVAGAEAARTVYVGLGSTGKSLYERTTRSSGIEHVQFIYAGGAHGGSAFAVRSVTESTSSAAPTSTPATIAMKYYHFDHLGSITAVSDELGHVAGPSVGAETTVLAYDPWGKRRSPAGGTSPASFALQVGHREFTGHETIPGVSLVNMNGRVYDPELGRFLSPDPNVQFVADLQSYNRYSYGANNPLRYTDPTGYFLDFLWSGDFWFNAFQIAIAAFACASSGPACVAFSSMMFMQSTALMLHNGASWKQVAVGSAVGILAGAAGGGVGGALGQAIGGGWGTLAGGLMSATVTTLLSAPYTAWSQHGRYDLGQGLLQSLTMAAVSAGASIGAQRVNPVSIASAGEQRGGGGSGAARAEVCAKKAAVGDVAKDQTRGNVVEGGVPSAQELAENPRVQAAIKVAYSSAEAGNAKLAHEEGGWIYWNPKTGDVRTFPASPGTAGTYSKGYFEIDLNAPRVFKDYVVVGTYHVHPLLLSDLSICGGKWVTGPSGPDLRTNAPQRVPGMVYDPSGLYLYGIAERTSTNNGAGFPGWKTAPGQFMPGAPL